MFTWLPTEFSVPAETPVTFHLTSIDVTHGFEIVRTNGQSMVVPDTSASSRPSSTSPAST
jgi:cytochrome c oxidase subunit 2